MEIIRAETAGFCFGVENAVNQAFEVVRKMEEAGTHVYTYGTLIHNRSVMKRLEEAGVTVIEQPADISPQRLADATVIIRAWPPDCNNRRLRTSGSHRNQRLVL